MIGKILPPITPLLLSMYFVVFLYSHNFQFVAMHQLWAPLGIAVAVALTTLGISLLFLRSLEKASLISFVFMILFWNYEPIYSVALRQFGNGIGHRHVLPVIIVIFILAVIWLLELSRIKDLNFRQPIFFACVTAILLFGFNTIQIFAGEVQRNSAMRAVHADGALRTVTNEQQYPNIYYIIMDEMADFHTIESFYGFDTTEFRQWLDNENFHVIEESFTKFNNTVQAIPALLNLDFNTPELRFNLVFEEKPLLLQILTERGYETAGITFLDRYISYFDREYRFASEGGSVIANELFDMIIERSMLSLVSFLQIELSGFEYGHWNINNYLINRVLEFDHNNEIPLFMYVHLGISRLPMVFTATGEFIAGNRMDDLEAYVATYKFSIEVVKNIVNHIRYIDDDSIIIIQADHGGLRYQIPSRYQYRIINLVYLPERFAPPSTPSLSPVNTLRHVLNEVFDMDFDTSTEDFFKEFMYEFS